MLTVVSFVIAINRHMAGEKGAGISDIRRCKHRHKYILQKHRHKHIHIETDTNTFTQKHRHTYRTHTDTHIWRHTQT